MLRLSALSITQPKRPAQNVRRNEAIGELANQICSCFIWLVYSGNFLSVISLLHGPQIIVSAGSINSIPMFSFSQPAVWQVTI